MELGKWLSKNDTLVMLEIINLSINCRSKDDFKELIERFRSLLQFDSCVVVSIDLAKIHDKEKPVFKMINTGFPLEYLDSYTKNHYSCIDPLYFEFVKTFEIQNSNKLKHLTNIPTYRPVTELRNSFGIENLFLYGLGDYGRNSLTVLNLAGRQIADNPRTQAIIEYMTPHLSLALSQSKENIFRLTTTELEVIKWIKEGKSSWEISVILGKSEWTINFHAYNVLKKLNAMNRAHAVALALKNNLIDI
jgi:LuxR family transcriptional regulator, quorum-sensing system regulator CviR